MPCSWLSCPPLSFPEGYMVIVDLYTGVANSAYNTPISVITAVICMMRLRSFDNTWNSPIATNNIYTVLDQLDVPLQTFVVDNQEYDDIYRAFIESGVRDIEAATDIGFMGVLYRAAEEHGLKYIVEGHSFRTEGVSPVGWLYMDGRYIREVHRRHGSVPMKTFPDMPFVKFVKWAALSGSRRLRPLYWIDYDNYTTFSTGMPTYD